MSEEVKETAGGELTQGEFKMKKKPRKLNKKDEPIKVDLSKKEQPKQEENAIQEQETTKIVLQSDEKKEEQVVELQEMGSTHEEESQVDNNVETKDSKSDRIVELPEDLNKLVKFMEDTGGTIQDYARLNTDYSSVDEKVLLKEYYKNTKPHLNSEEIDFVMEDKFHYDEDIDEERDIKKKKLAMKEEIAKAKNFLEETKEKYYEEIKLKSNVNPDQQKAMDFFNRYNEEQEQLQARKESFINKNKEYLSKDFKGFEFNLGDRKFNYTINNTDNMAKEHSEMQGFVRKFLNEDGSMKDAQGYHKAFYAARHADVIAKHFYEQGKADGIKNIVDKSKNIETASRPQNDTGDIYINGLKVKAISGVDSSKLKIQKKK